MKTGKINPNTTVSFPGFQRILDWTCPTADSYTKLLLHMDGVNGGTSFIDETGKTITAVNATTSTADKKFGVTSGSFNGTNRYLTAADSADFTLGTSDFTMDAWYNWSSLAGSQWMGGSASTSDGWFAYIGGGLIYFNAFQNSVTGLAAYNFAFTPTLGTWYHIAFVRNGSNFYIFVNGVSQTLSAVTPIASNSIPSSGSVFDIGRRTYNTDLYFNGYIDEFRFSKGIARWTSDFSVPTAPYTDNTSSIMLAVNGDVDKEYKIYVYMPSVKTVYVRLNNDGGSNYGRRYVDNNNGSVTTAGDAVVCFYTGGGFGVEMAELSLLTPSSNIKTCLVMRCDLISGTTIRDINVTGYSYNSTANITLLSFLSSSAEFSAGTKISVYARRA